MYEKAFVYDCSGYPIGWSILHKLQAIQSFLNLKSF
jgi:hypothetical protein